MMSRGHAATGGAGLALIGLVPGLFVTQYILAAAIVVGAGYALWPDMDHPKATAATTWGFLSRGVAHVIDKFSAWVYFTTRRGGDAKRHGGHRTLTHTLFWAILSGVGAYFLAFNIFGNMFIIFFGMCLGLRGLFPKSTNKGGKLFLYATAALVPIGIFNGAFPGLTPFQLGIIVGAGSFIHVLGDCLTDSGAAIFWPIPIHGQIWYRWRFPARFSTGSKKGLLVELWIKILCVMVIVAVFGWRLYVG